MKLGQGSNTSNGPDTEVEDPMLLAALRDFRASVNHWSEAACHRTRPAVQPATRRTASRRSLAWALGLVITAGLAGSGVYEHHHHQVLAQRAHQLELQREKALAAQRAQEDAQRVEDLLAKVDTDVSREVPAAMEPLAQLMDDGGR